MKKIMVFLAVGIMLFFMLVSAIKAEAQKETSRAVSRQVR